MYKGFIRKQQVEIRCDMEATWRKQKHLQNT